MKVLQIWIHVILDFIGEIQNNLHFLHLFKNAVPDFQKTFAFQQHEDAFEIKIRIFLNVGHFVLLIKCRKKFLEPNSF